MKQRVVPKVTGFTEFSLQRTDNMAGGIGHRRCSEYQREHNNTNTPAFREQPEILDPAVHDGLEIPDHRFSLTKKV